MDKVLMIDDDVELTALVDEFLKAQKYEVIAKHTPEEGLNYLEKNKVDIIILDIMLPGMDGFQVLRKIRESISIPIIMLTARGEVTDRIVGLEIGADDYLPKPFEPRELVARIQNVLRRSADRRSSDVPLKFGDLAIDTDRRTAELAGESLDLTTMEYQLLALFAENPGRTFTRDEILNALRGIDAKLFSRSVDILVSRLRQKLQDTTKQPQYIKTVWGTGYIFIGQETA